MKKDWPFRQKIFDPGLESKTKKWGQIPKNVKVLLSPDNVEPDKDPGDHF